MSRVRIRDLRQGITIYSADEYGVRKMRVESKPHKFKHNKYRNKNVDYSTHLNELYCVNIMEVFETGFIYKDKIYLKDFGIMENNYNNAKTFKSRKLAYSYHRLIKTKTTHRYSAVYNNSFEYFEY